jgi:cation diffusion facilitator family transporter
VTSELTKNQKAVRAIYVSIVGSVLLALVKGIVGYVGHSFALIADAIESSADVFSSLLVLFGLHYASRPADKNHPYGHGRAEPLITFAVVGFLLVSATIITIQSIENILHPDETPEWYTLVVLAGIMIFKEISYRYVNRKSEETNSTSLRADAWHHRSDALTSLMAFIGISIALFFGKGFETADDWAALFAAALIIVNAYLIFRPALGEIMDEHQHEVFIEDIRSVAEKTEGVMATEKCYVRKTGMHFLVDLHIEVNGDLSVAYGHEIAHRVKDNLMAFSPDIIEVMIHVEPFYEQK